MQYREIHYAVIIDTKTTETLSSIGLVNGKIKIISDGYAVPETAYFEDNSPVGNNWVTLLNVDGLARTGTRIDITNGGDYAYLSGMNISLANRNIGDTASYHDSLQQLQEAWLVGASVQFFIVFGEEFIQRWEGIIDGVDFDEETFTFSASDKLTKEFKQLPAVSGNQIAIGDIKYSPLIPVATKDEETVLLESHTICRILPYGDKYASGTYAKDAMGWSADYWAPASMDIVGFQSQKQYPTALVNSAVVKHNRRLLTPIDNRDYWVILELTVDHPEWIGKTITVNGNDCLILDVVLDVIPDSNIVGNINNQVGLWVLAKDLAVSNVITESLFGVPKSIYFADNCVNSDDANGVLGSLKSFSTEKAICTISDKLKVLQFSKDTSLTELATDENGNILFYTKSADGTIVPVKIQATVDTDNNIVIVNESKRRELVIPDRISISSSAGFGFEAKYQEPYYDPIYNNDTGMQYHDESYFDGSNYDLRELYNGRNLYHEVKDTKCIYAVSGQNPIRQNNTLAEHYAIKVMMEFDSIDTEQNYKPFLFLQSDYYEGQQWASTFEGAQFPHKPAVLPFAKSTYPEYDTYDPAHNETGNTLNDLYFYSLMPTHQDNFLSLSADAWTVNVYPVIVHDTLGYITQSGLDSELKPVVPYTFDLPKRKTDSELLRTFYEHPEHPDNGQYTKLYAWEASATYAVCTAPKELIPDNSSVGASININYFRQWKIQQGVNDTQIVTEFTIQPVTMGVIRVGDTHSEYLQVATDSGNERQFLMDGTSKANNVNAEIPTISSDTIKTATANGTTRLLFEISSEYLIDRELFQLGGDFNFPAHIDDRDPQSLPIQLTNISPEVLKIMGIGLMIDDPISIGDLFVSLKSKVGDLVPTDNVYGALHYMTDTYSGLLGDYSSLPSQRTNLWNTGRVIQQQQNTFNYIQELCQQSFVCGWTNRMGDINYSVLNPSFTASSDDDLLVLHDENIIIMDSITGFSLSPLSQVYNEFDVQFAYNYATGKYDKQYSVKNVDEDAFPASTGNWKEFVIGIDDYLMAKDIWELCHSGYLQTKTVNKAPDNLTNLIWATDLTILGDSRADQYNEYAYQYLKLLAKWTTRQKWIVEYDLPISPDTAKLEIMQRVRFHDPIITPNGYGVGYITSINVVSNDDTIHIGLMFEKLGSRQIVPTEDVVITETGTAITITETGIAIKITEQ